MKLQLSKEFKYKGQRLIDWIKESEDNILFAGCIVIILALIANECFGGGLCN